MKNVKVIIDKETFDTEYMELRAKVLEYLRNSNGSSALIGYAESCFLSKDGLNLILDGKTP